MNRLQLEFALFKFFVGGEPRDSFDETRPRTIDIQLNEFVIAATFIQAEELPQPKTRGRTDVHREQLPDLV